VGRHLSSRKDSVSSPEPCQRRPGLRPTRTCVDDTELVYPGWCRQSQCRYVSEITLTDTTTRAEYRTPPRRRAIWSIP